MKRDSNFEGLVELYTELQKPIHHTPTSLGINKFKKEAKAAGLRGSFLNRVIRAYKKRSWMEYRGVVRHRGTFPTHPAYGDEVKVSITETETTVNVRTK